MFPTFDYEYVTYDELYQAYTDCRKHKWKTANAAIFQISLSKNLYKLWVDLNRGKYHIGRSIAFIVDKPVKREVFAADFRDRIVHHLIINRLLSGFEKEMIKNSFSCRKGKGTLYGIKTLESELQQITRNYTQTAFILKCDLKSFFMSISKKILLKKVESLIMRNYSQNEKQCAFMLNLIRLVINNCPQVNCMRKHSKRRWDSLPQEKSLFHTSFNFGIPIGNLTSQIFANYFLSDFDNFIYDKLGFKYYGRYVDDFYILSDDKDRLLSAIPMIKEKLNEMEIKLHPKKIYLQNAHKGVKFIGAVVKPGRIYISNRTVGNLKQMLYNFSDRLNFDDPDTNEVESFVSSFNSYMGFLKHYATFNIRKKVVLSELMAPFYKIVYFNSSLTKMSPFREYSNRKTISYENIIKNGKYNKIDVSFLPAIILNDN